jgi:hypothetical protein
MRKDLMPTRNIVPAFFARVKSGLLALDRNPLVVRLAAWNASFGVPLIAGMCGGLLMVLVVGTQRTTVIIPARPVAGSSASQVPCPCKGRKALPVASAPTPDPAMQGAKR